MSANKPPFDGEWVKLGELISKAPIERCGDGKYPVYSMTMRDGIVEQAGRFKKAIASKDTSSYKVAKKNQLVVGFPIDEGVIYVQHHDASGIMSPAYNVWNINLGRVDPTYLEFALHSPRSMAYYADKMRGTTARRRTLTAEGLREMEILLPSADGQIRVVNTLDEVRSQIKEANGQIAMLDTLVKSRFVEMFGDPVINSLQWSYEKLSDNAKLINGRAYKQSELLSEGKYKVLRVGNFFSNSSWYYSDLELDEKKYCHDGDLLYAWSASFGPKIWRGEKSIFHYHIWKIVLNEDRYDKTFMCSLLEHSKMAFLSDAHGIGMFHLTKSGMEQARFIVPPLSLQQEFASFAAEVDKSRFIVQQKIEKLQMLYDSLSQEYFG